jgi:hypothetical protein
MSNERVSSSGKAEEPLDPTEDNLAVCPGCGGVHIVKAGGGTRTLSRKELGNLRTHRFKDKIKALSDSYTKKHWG